MSILKALSRYTHAYTHTHVHTHAPLQIYSCIYSYSCPYSCPSPDILYGGAMLADGAVDVGADVIGAGELTAPSATTGCSAPSCCLTHSALAV
jgi:hypothetical protein